MQLDKWNFKWKVLSFIIPMGLQLENITFVVLQDINLYCIELNISIIKKL